MIEERIRKRRGRGNDDKILKGRRREEREREKIL